jgi:segregation and condensation protein A
VPGVPAQAEVYRPRPQTLWQLSDAIARLRQLLDALPNGSPLMAFLPEVDGTEPQRVLRGRVAVSSTPVAALELARERLGARSGCLWTPIRVRHRDDHSAVQDAVGPLA